MYVGVFEYVCVHVYILCEFVHVCMCKCVCMCVYVYEYMCVCTYRSMCMYVCVWICLHEFLEDRNPFLIIKVWRYAKVV